MKIRQTIAAIAHCVQRMHLTRAQFRLLAALVFGLFATISTQASAGAIWNGTNVTVEWNYPNIGSAYGSPVTVTANPGVTILGFIPGNPEFNFTFTSTGVVISSGYTNCCFSPATFNGLKISDNSVDFTTAPPILTANTWAQPGGTTFDASNITYDAHDIYLNFSGTAFVQDTSSITLDVSNADAVPEPFTLSLFGAGLAGAAALSRRKKKVA